MVVVAVVSLAWTLLRPRPVKWSEYTVEKGNFRVTFNSMGTITPKNKIVVSSPLGGRVDRVLREEGDVVKKGDVLAWVSSADRVALMDAIQSGDADASWTEMYKPAPVRSPVDGRIIAKTVVQGQTVAPETALYELSDVLIVVSKVDETDIGKVRLDQVVDVRVDAFPDNPVKARVTRVGEKSTVLNNVTAYEVFLEPEQPFATTYRAGMNVSVDYIVREVDDAVVLPTWITEGRQRTEFQLKVRDENGDAEDRAITLGPSNGQLVEVTQGLRAGDRVLYQPMEYKQKDNSGSPFGLGGGGGRRR
ncbi:MAG: efflux RND transporter periplasmic adaptor subunit [Thauera sp.]|nr:efflux RND transporter periplasmic adaptor subunit [Thauera sp.]